MSNRECWVIGADGDDDYVTPPNGKKWEVQELKDIIKADRITALNVPKGACGYAARMVVDEQGMLLQKPLNHNASLMMGQPIVGDVIVCPTRTCPI